MIKELKIQINQKNENDNSTTDKEILDVENESLKLEIKEKDHIINGLRRTAEQRNLINFDLEYENIRLHIKIKIEREK